MLILRTLALLSLIGLAQAQTNWELLWETPMPNPESVAVDKGVLYVSNQGFNDPEGGSIGKMDLKGQVIAKHWVKGLDSPKGIAIRGRSLFVSDVKELVEIDMDKAKIIKRYSREGSEFLNDVVVGSDNAIYVSDMSRSAIYRLDDQGEFGLWLESEELDNPNGLLARDGELLLAGWGGHLVQVSLKDQKITRLSGAAPVGNLDGIQNFGDGQLIVSDWAGGDIYIFDRHHQPTRVLELEQSLGDIAYTEGLLILPFANPGKVSAYRAKD